MGKEYKRTIIISEATERLLKEEMEMTEYKFKGSVKRFLSDLIKDPITSEPGNVLTLNGLSRAKLIKILVKRGILEKHMKIVDKNADGETMEAKMKVTFKVPKPEGKRPQKEFDKKLHRLYVELFEKNLPKKREVNESMDIFTPNEIDRLIGNNRGDQIEQMEDNDINVRYGDDLGSSVTEIEECTAGGAVGAGPGVGNVYSDNPSGVGFIAPMDDVQRRDIYPMGTPKKKRKSEVDEATTTANTGEYQYTVPFPVDEEDPTMKRHTGVGGSESINIAENK